MQPNTCSRRYRVPRRLRDQLDQMKTAVEVRLADMRAQRLRYLEGLPGRSASFT